MSPAVCVLLVQHRAKPLGVGNHEAEGIFCHGAFKDAARIGENDIALLKSGEHRAIDARARPLDPFQPVCPVPGAGEDPAAKIPAEQDLCARKGLFHGLKVRCETNLDVSGEPFNFANLAGFPGTLNDDGEGRIAVWHGGFLPATGVRVVPAAGVEPATC